MENCTKLNENNPKYITLCAIKDFVVDLWSIYGSKLVTPLALYHRLLSHVSDKESEDGLEKYISGFKVFFTNCADFLTSVDKIKTLPRDTAIRYGQSPKVYLEIQKYVYLCKNNIQQIDIIRQHLLTISASISPSEQNISSLESATPILEKMGLNDGSIEGQFVGRVIQKAKKAMTETKSDDPSAAISNLMTSGVITDMIKGMQSGVNGKNLDPNKLLGSLQGAMSLLMEETTKPDAVEEEEEEEESEK